MASLLHSFHQRGTYVREWSETVAKHDSAGSFSMVALSSESVCELSVEVRWMATGVRGAAEWEGISHKPRVEKGWSAIAGAA